MASKVLTEDEAVSVYTTNEDRNNMDILEKLCRHICNINGIAPDQENTGNGSAYSWANKDAPPKGYKYKLWQLQLPVARVMYDSMTEYWADY